jgi:hypothetical protein
MAAAAPLGGAQAATVATIYSFTGGSDGTMPTTGLVSGPNNVFYGATSTTVYSLTEDGNGKWHEAPIYASGFPGINSLVGTKKALYGSLGLGSGTPCPQEPSEGCGSIVELTPPVKGGTTWTATTIYDFPGGQAGPRSGRHCHRFDRHDLRRHRRQRRFLRLRFARLRHAVQARQGWRQMEAHSAA